ncbi:MAG: hypothetical protein V1876_01575 [Candidatus Peregrinibacteria bacterium]
MISVSTSVVLLISIAMPAMAMVDASAVANRISRRLLGDKILSEQRIPVGEVQTTLHLRERMQAMPDATGLSNLARSRITTRVRTLRGARVQNMTGNRPTRRSIINNAESMLVLPPALVQTGDIEVMTQKVTRRTLINLTEQANRVHADR